MEEVFYGVYIPPELLVGREEPVPTVYTDISSLNKVGQFILILYTKYWKRRCKLS